MSRRVWPFVALLFGCRGAEDGAWAYEAACVSMCEDVAQCRKFCDPQEDPGCDEQAKYEELRAACVQACTSGAPAHAGTCEVVLEPYAECVERSTCAE